MARSSTSASAAVGSAGVHRMHTCRRYINSIYQCNTWAGGRPAEPSGAVPARSAEAGPTGAPDRARGEYPWPGELPTRSARRRADVPDRGAGRVPARPQRGRPRVSARAGSPASTSATPTPSCSGPPRNLGRPTGEQCPICEEADLVDVTFVFGSRLPSGGRCVATQAELDPLLAAQGAGGLLRGRGLRRLLVEPPGPHVPGRRRDRCVDPPGPRPAGAPTRLHATGRQLVRPLRPPSCREPFGPTHRSTLPLVGVTLCSTGLRHRPCRRQPSGAGRSIRRTSMSESRSAPVTVPKVRASKRRDGSTTPGDGHRVRRRRAPGSPTPPGST